MARTIHVHPRAYADILDTTSRIQRRSSPSSAARWHNGVWARIRSLAKNPDMWPLADEAADLGLELRELLHGRRRQVYRILFTIDGQTVNIHRVRHAAQDRLAPGDI